MLDLLSETGKLRTKPCNARRLPNMKFTEDGELFEHPEWYRRQVGKLNYLTVTQSNIASSINIVSQFMASPKKLLDKEYCIKRLISTRHVKTREQLGDIFTKALNWVRVDYLYNKVRMINIYASTWGRVLQILRHYLSA